MKRFFKILAIALALSAAAQAVSSFSDLTMNEAHAGESPGV